MIMTMFLTIMVRFGPSPMSPSNSAESVAHLKKGGGSGGQRPPDIVPGTY